MPSSPNSPSSYGTITDRLDVPSRYVDYRGDSSFTVDRGVIPIPLAGPDGSAPVLVKVHAEIGYRTTDVTAAKFGAPPVLPAACDTPSGDMILGCSYDYFMPQISPNQDSYIYRADAKMTYVQGSLRGSGGSSTFQTIDYPYHMDLIDLGVQGLIGGVIGAITGGNILDPLYSTYTNDYAGAFNTSIILR